MPAPRPSQFYTARYRTYDTGAMMKLLRKGTPCEAALEASVARLSAAANRTVCDLVAVDFTCFDLPRSPSCA